MKTIFFILIILSLFSCAGNLNTKSNENRQHKIDEPIIIENTLFDNKESEKSSIYTKINSLNQNDKILIILNNEEIKLNDFKKKQLDSDNIKSIKIINDKELIKEFTEDFKIENIIFIETR